MPLDHTGVTATVSVTGLALGCYNRATRNWEVALLRHPRHVLNIDVKTTTPEGETKVTFQVDGQHNIFVEAENVIEPETPLFMPGAPFDRQAEGNDPEDLRWLVDLENELNNGDQVVLRRPAFPVTEMYVSSPVLYADFKAIRDTQLIKMTADNATTPFGKLSETGKADIRCQDGGRVLLRIEGPLGFNVPLPHVPGTTHQIEIDNSCPDPPLSPSGEPSSDFKLYYEVVKDTGGDKFDLKAVGEGPISGDGGVCNLGNLGARDHLFPIT